MSFRPGRDTGFAKWPPCVDPHPAERAAGVTYRKPRVIPGRLYMNKRGRWVLP
jgi:hypothetical protein